MLEEKCSKKLERISKLLEIILKKITNKSAKFLASSIPSKCPTGKKETLLSKKSDKRSINSLSGTVS